MTQLAETADTSLDPATAFANVGDFANIEKWDPGVNRSVKASPGETAVGTTYDLTLNYNGRTMPMTYTVTEYEPGRRIVLEGEGDRVKAIDTISFEPIPTGTRVTYEADLALTGIARIFQPFMKGRFEAIGAAAGVGLRAWLKQLES